MSKTGLTERQIRMKIEVLEKLGKAGDMTVEDARLLMTLREDLQTIRLATNPPPTVHDLLQQLKLGES